MSEATLGPPSVPPAQVPHLVASAGPQPLVAHARDARQPASGDPAGSGVFTRAWTLAAASLAAAVLFSVVVTPAAAPAAAMAPEAPPLGDVISPRGGVGPGTTLSGATTQPDSATIASSSSRPGGGAGGAADGGGGSGNGGGGQVVAVATVAAPPTAGCGSDGLCPGDVNGTLNTCSLAAPSCVSVMADDEAHFVAPWEYEPEALLAAGRRRPAGPLELPGARPPGDVAVDGREAAVARLLEVALGGYYEPGLSTDAYVTNGYSRFDAAGYLIQGAFSSVTGAAPPPRPQPLRDARAFRPFDGMLEDRHVTQEGSLYVRIRLSDGGGDPRVADSGAPLVAEFLFPEGDNIVTLRCSEVSEQAPEAEGGGTAALDGSQVDAGAGPSVRRSGLGGRLALSFEHGLEWDTNTARRRMEELRKALRWEVVPVVSEFDPKFNNDKPLWFERLYEPFRTE